MPRQNPLDSLRGLAVLAKTQPVTYNGKAAGFVGVHHNHVKAVRAHVNGRHAERATADELDNAPDLRRVIGMRKHQI